jgi:hypothetical protein
LYLRWIVEAPFSPNLPLVLNPKHHITYNFRINT